MINAEATLRIDNQIVEFSKGETILDAARHAGIYIPTLCYVEDLTPYGNILQDFKYEGNRRSWIDI